MQKVTGIWLLMAVVLLCYLVPYTLLSSVHEWYGSFLFWTLAGLVVIAINVIMTRDFKGK